MRTLVSVLLDNIFKIETQYILKKKKENLLRKYMRVRSNLYLKKVLSF